MSHFFSTVSAIILKIHLKGGHGGWLYTHFLMVAKRKRWGKGVGVQYVVGIKNKPLVSYVVV